VRRALVKLCGVSLVGFVAGSVVTACGGGSQTGGSNSSSGRAGAPGAPGSSGSSPAPTTTSSALKTSIGDGTWVVGKDIAPGTYSTQNAGYCTYDAMSSSGGGNRGKVSSGDSTGQVQVSIDPDVTTFTTHGCGTWVKQ
jgi:hypothetical protein